MGRVGTKRSDKRWLAPDGVVWASKFEWSVYDQLKQAGYVVRKCENGAVDTFDYHSVVKNGECLACNSSEVVQRRTYTPDLFVCTEGSLGQSTGNVRGFYLETKGYFPASKRSLFRNFRKTGPDIDIRFLAQRDSWVTKGKTKLSDYFAKYIKDVPFAVWNGKNLPGDW